MADYTKQDNENLFEFMQRLAQSRAGGVLGGGGMMGTQSPAQTTQGLTMPELTKTELGMLSLLKRPQTGDSSGMPMPQDMRTPEERLRDSVRNLSEMGGADTVKDIVLQFMPYGGAIGGAIDYFDSKAVEEQLAERYSPEQVKEYMANPYTIADLYASGAMVNNPMVDGFDVSKAGTGLFNQLSTIPDRVSSFFSGDPYNAQPTAATKVFGAPQYMDFGFTQSSVSPQLQAQIDYDNARQAELDAAIAQESRALSGSGSESNSWAGTSGDWSAGSTTADSSSMYN